MPERPAALAPAWEPAPRERLRLPAGEVHVWRAVAGRRGAVPLPPPASVLDAAEREHLRALRNPEVRERFGWSRTLRRLILARYLDLPPRSIRFAEGPHGKPGLAGSGLHFNVSHSGGLLLMAVAGDEVGVDVEWLGKGRPLAALAHRFFSAAEQEILDRAPESERGERFHAMWTEKEALTKLHGLSLAQGLQRHRAGLFDAGGTVAFAAAAGYLGAVALLRPPALLRWFDLA